MGPVLAIHGAVATRGGDLARTDRATYEAGDGLVRGDRPVTIRGDEYAFEGPRFTLDPSNGRVVVEGGARQVCTDPEVCAAYLGKGTYDAA